MKSINNFLITLFCLSGPLALSAQTTTANGSTPLIHWNAPICTKIPGEKNRLTWTAAETVTTKYYEVLRSADGLNFSTIGTVAANKEDAGNYMFEDKTPLSITYYQICSVNSIGEKTYSAKIKATSATNNISVRAGYKESTLVFNDNSSRVITLMNMNGQRLINANTSDLQYTIKTQGLSRGIYIVRIDEETATEIRKIMVL